MDIKKSTDPKQSKKILIIEDHTPTRLFEKILLEQAGFAIIEAKDADQGISLATTHTPDLIIMDIRLPYKKRGIGAAQIIRKEPRTAHIPIIFVTGYAQGEYSHEIQHISLCGYITKPFRAESFAGRIQNYLSLAQSSPLRDP